jgi:signal transduction histidine kinase/DNA-binding NarL/FixJ family response regulator
MNVMADPDRSLMRRWAPPRLGIVLASAVLAVLAWLGAELAVNTQRWEELRQVHTQAANVAIDYADRLHRELLSMFQLLNILDLEWGRDPAHFDLAQWERQLLDDPTEVTETFMLDTQGVVVASSSPALIGLDLADREYFRTLVNANTGRPYVGAPVLGRTSGQWVINIARRLNDPARHFAGAMVVSYRLTSLADRLGGTEIGRTDEAAVIGADGRVRALLTPTPRAPGASIAGTRLMGAMSGRAATWTGPSAFDGRTRIYAFRPVPGTDLTVAVGTDEAAALAGSDAWRLTAYGFAGLITMLIVVMAATLLHTLREGQGREQRLARDRTVLARANAELEAVRSRTDAKTAQLEGTIAGMSDGISLLDRDLRLVAWNENFPSFSGVPREMLRVGLPMEEILRAQARAGEFGPMADENAVEAEVGRRIAALRAGSRVGVMERERPDGRVLELRRSALPGGGFVTLYTDITARKEVEVAHRRARELAEAAAEEKSRFVAIVSHEIRTPLNVTLNALALLEQSALDPEQRRLTVMALDAGDALRTLLTDILDLSRMEVGRLTLRKADCALPSLLHGVIEMFRAAGAARGVMLGLSIGPGVPDRLVTDPGRLRQVVMNLVSNAVKFADPGPTTLVAETGLQDGRSVLRLALRDPGPAIGAADRERLFRPFSQLSAGQSGVGAGLGLAICQVLAALLGGRIGCDPVGEDGKEFWVTLPLEQSLPLPAPEAPPAAQGLTGRRPRGRVLLVEDVLASQVVIATVLRREGHAVEAVASGEAAIREAASRPFDIILMDVHMPGMNGLEAARRIRAQSGPGAAVPILALTANASDQDRRHCLEAGMNDVLPKPVERAMLIKAIEHHMRGGKALAVHPAPLLPEPAGPVAELDLARIARLRDELPPGLFGELAGSCLHDLRERQPALAAAVAARDAQSIVAAAHAMAGVAESYGLNRLAVLLRDILEATRAAELDRAAMLEAGVEDALAGADRAVRELLTPEPA